MSAVPTLAPLPVDRGRGAVIWYAYLIIGFFTYLNSIQGNILPFLRAELDLSYGVVALHTSAIAFGMLLVGALGDRLTWAAGRGGTARIGGIGSVAAALFLCAAPVAWASVASCFLIGLFGALLPMTSSALISGVPRDRRDIVFAEANVMAYVFAIAGPILSGLCVWLGWNWRLAILAGAASGVVILAAYWRTPIPAGFWGYWAALGLGVAVEFSILLWAPAYLHDVIGLDTTASAIGAAAFFAAMLIGRTAGTALLRVASARTLYFGSIATTLVGFVLYWSTAIPAVALIGLFVVGLGIAMVFPLAISTAIGAAGAAADRASTRVIIGPALAILLGPPALGSLADYAGLWVAQSMTAVLTILAVAAFLTGDFLMRAKAKAA